MKRLHPAPAPLPGGPVWPAPTDWARTHAGELAHAFAPLAGDIALVLDAAGVVLAAAEGEVPGGHGWTQAWVGRAWADTVAADCRAKVTRMVRARASTGQAGKCEVNHPADDGHGVPVAWSAIRLGDHGPSLAIGRDLSAVARQQQRLLDLQAQLEAALWQLREPGAAPKGSLN